MMRRSEKAFSLIEVIVVLIIIGILVTVGISYYFHVVEKSRVSEAKNALMEIRTIWNNYALEHKDTLNDLGALYEYMRKNDEAIPASIPETCTKDSYFSYSIVGENAVAQRCTIGSGGKSPAKTAYNVTVNLANGSWGGTEGYY